MIGSQLIIGFLKNYLEPFHKVGKNYLYAMCLFRKSHLQGLRSPKMRSLLLVNEQFSGKLNAVNGTLWTDTI
jgi:hypothetical protein